jgi:hypothetical protein
MLEKEKTHIADFSPEVSSSTDSWIRLTKPSC